ncbi:MAG: metal-dependent hydrolase [Bdellovibrionia bacterium]
MDNITHSLIGVAAAEFALQKSPGADKKKRRFWLASSIIGNNFPDLDIIYTRITPAPLGSLLHHRGHTHTLLGLLPQWLLIFAILWFLRKPLRLDTLDAKAWRGAGILGAVGLLLHLVADSWNSYGVHPYFPFWNGWIYGDAIFIVEPFLWAMLAAVVWLTGETKLKFIPAGLLVLLSAYGLIDGILGVFGLAFIAATFSGLVLIYRKRPERVAFGALALTAAFVAFHFSASRWIKSILVSTSETRVLDIALTPLPATPLCWFAIQMSLHEGTYEVKRGVFSLWPELLPPSKCPDLGRVKYQISETINYGGAEMLWTSRYAASLEEFRILESRCDLRAWMRFARVPFIENGAAVDLRFSRGGLRNFTGFESEAGACPPYVPPWIPPRWDLVQALQGEAWFKND